MTTASFTHCLCDHLAFVGSSFSVPPNQQIVFEDTPEVVIDPIKSDLVTFITAGISALAIVSILLACVVDYVSRSKVCTHL